jgi:AraC-like DNA-binding protein
LDAGAVICFGRTRLPLEARAIYLVPAWITWDGTSRPGVRHIYAHFDLPGIAGALSQRIFPRPVKIFPPPGSAAPDGLNLAREFEGLARALKTAETPDPMLTCWAKSLIYRSLRDAFGQVPRALRTQFLQPAVGIQTLDPLLRYIEEHLAEELGNDRLAKRLACSRASLTRLFRRHLRISPSVYVAERRISRASELLVQSDASLEEIAEACGFPNRYYFTRVYSRMVGVPPAAYRKLGAR